MRNEPPTPAPGGKPPTGPNYGKKDLLTGLLPALLLGTAGGPAASGSFAAAYLGAKRSAAESKNQPRPGRQAKSPAGAASRHVEAAFQDFDPAIQEAEAYTALMGHALRTAHEPKHPFFRRAAARLAEATAPSGEVDQRMRYLHRLRSSLQLAHPHAVDPAISQGYASRIAHVENVLQALTQLNHSATQIPGRSQPTAFGAPPRRRA